MAMSKEDQGLDFQESESFEPENMLMDELLSEYTPEDSIGFQPVKTPELEPTPSASSEGEVEAKTEVDETPEVKPEQIPEWEEVKKRLERAEEDKKKAEARAGYWQRQAEKAKEEPAKPTAAPPPDVSDLVAPKEEDFDTERDFLIALADHRADVKIREWEAKSRQQTEITAEEKAHDAFKRKLVAEGPAMFDDFAEAISDPILPITDGILNILKETEVPVELTYYLAKNAKECAVISRMSPVAAARAIGKIEAQIVSDKQHLKESGSEHPAAEVKTQPKPISKAPAPITPIKSQSAPITKDPSKMTNEEYRLWRAARSK